MNKTEHRYKLVKAEDGIIWLPLQPIIEDIKERAHDPVTEDYVKVPLLYVQSFLEALVQEGKQQ